MISAIMRREEPALDRLKALHPGDAGMHGLRVDEAKAALRQFLADALAHNLRCVRIIHGKGMNSGPRGPVIKTAVNMILRKTAPVLAFTSARRVDGGTGAINVLLYVRA